MKCQQRRKSFGMVLLAIALPFRGLSSCRLAEDPSKFSFLLDPGVPEVNRGGKQAPLFASGNECLNGSFPHLDVIRRAFVMDSVLPPGII
jgi:hypothetical protein